MAAMIPDPMAGPFGRAAHLLLVNIELSHRPHGRAGAEPHSEPLCRPDRG